MRQELKRKHEALLYKTQEQNRMLRSLKGYLQYVKEKS